MIYLKISLTLTSRADKKPKYNRTEFSSDIDYGNFVRVKIKSGMIVQYMGGSGGLIPVGTLGQVDSKVDERNAVVVTWQNGKTAVHGLSPNVNEIEIIAAPSY